MANKKTIYKTLVSIIVLSEDPITNLDLRDIAYEIDEGDCVGYKLTFREKQLNGKKAVKATYDAGSEPGFFFMNEEGVDTMDE